MKKLLLHLFLLLFVLNLVQKQDAKAQAGMWTWVNGDSIPNSPGVFGVQGVPSPLNHPPALYEPCEWTDLNGNFWLYGGFSAFGVYADLWLYDPTLNTWTWTKGTGQPGYTGNYGIKGVSSINNMPPAGGYGYATWVDLNGDFWLYGGGDGIGSFNTLWRYNIASNMWTWIHGVATVNQPSVHGVLGISDPNNTPGSRSECNSTWVDNNNNLWLFGGFGSTGSNWNDLWKYNTIINEWTWMKGSNAANHPGIYGIKGIPSTSNVPPSRWAYCHWKDGNGNFYFFGGGRYPNFASFNDMWMYNPITNEWTWISGTNVLNDSGHYGVRCIPSILNLPPSRFENRSFWTDAQGNFLLYGGVRGTGFQEILGDLWSFSPTTMQWTFIAGDTLTNQLAIFGSLGVASPLNKPGKHFGAVSWYHSQDNSLYLFGGYAFQGDLWRYEIDSNCPSNQSNIPIINLSSSDTTFCEKNCINFFDLSTNNPTSWQWYFPGASPDTSTLQNPTNICYNTYGNYDVTLIACNANGCDSLH